MNQYLSPFRSPVIIFFSILVLTACGREASHFERIDPSQSGIDFVNEIVESDSLNILDYEYIYNGAGVAAADFNGNGYTDLFFVGNMVSNRLYLNHGEFQFEDVTEPSGVAGNNEKWYSGVAVVDINNNGLPDLYVSATGKSDPELRRNELYINQGPDENGVPVFLEMAAEYGLDDPSYTTQAYFLDYNNDGILDVYLLVAHSASSTSYTNPAAMLSGGEEGLNRDKLLQGRWDDELGHPVFSDVSESAGINKEGYGLGVNVVDINGNGWKDIYVANDYITDDLFWINNGDGTFTERAGELFKHFSFSAMGTDFGDLNNNGLFDIYTLDMLPEINVRRKMMANPNNYRNFVNRAFEGYHPQYTRNTLQMNYGMDQQTGDPIFSEIALQAGVGETDWSWAALLADFDNSGYRDILVTNGIPRDITDKDFWEEYGRVMGVMPSRVALPSIPQVKIPNYIFKNMGTDENDRYAITFEDKSSSWGLHEETYSTGAVYADLNNNGRLDLVINNINQPAFVYRNGGHGEGTSPDNNWLKLEFEGPDNNRMGLCARVDLYWNGRRQAYEHTLQRGYLSSVDPVVHIGLGSAETVDSLVVQWPVTDVENPKRFRLRDIEANQTVLLRYSESRPESAQNEFVRATTPLFEEISENRGLVLRQEIRPFDDFHLQPLIPYQLSDHGTGFAVGDLTGNGLDDVIAGGSVGESPVLFIQNEEGQFEQRDFSPEGDPALPMYEDMSLLLFDANGNGLNDLYIASGGVRHTAGNSLYRDRFYRNNGDGQFALVENAVPDDAISSSVVIAADFNENGKPDLFVGGRVTPGRYPEAVPSRILINETDEHGIRFRDVTYDLAPALLDLSAVNDAVWTDFSGNGRPDLVIASEWSPVLFFENREGKLVDVTNRTGVPESAGWWFSLTEADLTGNGLPDFVAGNIGRNELLRPSSDEPVSIYYGDLTDNGFFEAITTHYIKDEDGRRQEFIYHHREDLFRAMPETGDRMPSHEQFGRTTFGQFLTRDEKNRARHKRVTSFDSVVLLNRGDGTFEERPLPASAQSSALFTAVPVHVDGNGVHSLLIAGNLAGADVQMGSYNAFDGLLLKGRGDGSFQTVSPAESGFRMSGDSRGWSPLRLADGKEAILIQLSTGEFRLWKGGGNS